MDFAGGFRELWGWGGHRQMANFQRVAGDRATRLDTAIGRLVTMLGDSMKIDLSGGRPPGSEPLVEVNDPSVGWLPRLR